MLPNQNFAHVRGGKGGLGKQAYQRIVNGESEYRNNDLYKAQVMRSNVTSTLNRCVY